MSTLCLEHANRGLRDLKPYQPGKPIETLQRELGLQKIIKLASNENPLGPSPKAIEAAQQVLSKVHLYPDPDAFNLKCALSQHLNLPSQHLTLGNGSDEVLKLIGQAFLNQDTDVIISEYAFATFSIIARGFNAKVIQAPAKNWGHDLSAILKAITQKTQMIFLANPNNPTGTWFSHDVLAEFLSQVPQHIIVVVDEAYYEFIDDKDYPNTLELQKHHHNLITTRTFSKIHGLAGLRVGYGISHPHIADMLNRVRLPFNANKPAQAAAIAALNDAHHLQRSLAINLEGKKFLQAAFDARGINYIPSATNFLTIDCGRDATPIYNSLLQLGVIVRPLTPYNMPQHLRISIGLAEENQILLDALQEVL